MLAVPPKERISDASPPDATDALVVPNASAVIEEAQRRIDRIDTILNGDELRWGPDSTPSPRAHNGVWRRPRTKTPQTAEDYERIEAAEQKRQRKKEKRR
jgi:hypothetical protein